MNNELAIIITNLLKNKCIQTNLLKHGGKKLHVYEAVANTSSLPWQLSLILKKYKKEKKIVANKLKSMQKL